MSKGEQVVDLKFVAARGRSVEVCFEPVGATFSLSDGDAVFLRTAISNVASLEIVSWPNGIGVWVPYPGDYAIIDSNGSEIDTL
ncbi:hypothetical protein [Micromonospora musae]|uniref:hypothetical protein n=1 Tax=Micromonospora musae TaxID=1894970 RepID=UPI001F3F2516|nr:hypothetical protein [Micromonospora musae]